MNERSVEIVERWHTWDGFIEGVVRVDGSLFHANMVGDDLESDDPRAYEARSLFHQLGKPGPAAIPDPGVLTFTEKEIVQRSAR